MSVFVNYEAVPKLSIVPEYEETGLVQRESVSLTLCATLGFRALYARITAAAAATAASSTNITDETSSSSGSSPFSVSTMSSVQSPDGRLVISPEMPLFGGRYAVDTIIGEGTFSQICSALDTFRSDGQQERGVAVKVLHAKHRAMGLVEARVLQLLNSAEGGASVPIVRLEAQFMHGRHFCSVMELMSAPLSQFCNLQQQHHALDVTEGADLLQQTVCAAAQPLPVEVIRTVALQLLSALDFLAVHGILHADLKPENVLLRLAVRPTDGTDEQHAQPDDNTVTLEDLVRCATQDLL